MNNKATWAIVIMVVAGLGGGAATWSWVHAGQVPDPAAHDHEHGEAGDDQAQPARHDHDHEDGSDCGSDAHRQGIGDLHEDDAHEDLEGHDEHAGHAHDVEEPAVQLSDAERNLIGLELATAGSGNLVTPIRLPGEVVLNDDRVAHIVPRAPGIVREVLKSAGDAVRAGEVMAWLESAELGEAKVDYLTRWAELGCCTIDLTRAREVHDNTKRFLKILESSPSPQVLREMSGEAMGEHRSELVSAYAELVFAEAAYHREKRLFEKKVASESESQAAAAAYKKADALYAARRDSIEFQIQRDLLEAQRARQVGQMQLHSAARRLFVLGLTRDDVAALEVLAQSKTAGATHKAACNDPNCKDCAGHAVEESDVPAADQHVIEQRLAWYPLRAPFDGTVIDKHLTLGEKRGDGSNAFTIADLSSVWVDINVYQKNLPHVTKGQVVRISTAEDGGEAEGVIAFVAPVIEEKTRTALARVVLPNPRGEWRPGLFVTAELSIGEAAASIVVPRTAVQRIGQEPVVFVEADGAIRPVVVSLGRGDANRTEVLSGLIPGQRYVVQGAFELKAKIVTSDMDAHAGHGH